MQPPPSLIHSFILAVFSYPKVIYTQNISGNIIEIHVNPVTEMWLVSRRVSYKLQRRETNYDSQMKWNKGHQFEKRLWTLKVFPLWCLSSQLSNVGHLCPLLTEFSLSLKGKRVNLEKKFLYHFYSLLYNSRNRVKNSRKGSS